MQLRWKGSAHWPRLLLVLFGGVALAYIALGVTTLVWDVDRSFPIDLRLRWTESRLVMQGINPQVAGHPDPELTGAHEVMKTLGGSYPPWAYAIGLLLAPDLPWPWIRAYAALLNLAALGILGAWTFGYVQRFGRGWAWVSVVTTLAMFPIAICISYGQYAVIVAACLAVVDHLLDVESKPRELAAGVLLGVACVKPQLGGLFVLAVLIERRWTTIAACFGFLALASGATWMLVGSDPVTMFVRSLQESSAFSFLSHNILVHWMSELLPGRVGTTVLGVAGVGVASALLFASRRETRLVRWSICAIVAMSWAYRKHYDVPLLIFPFTCLLLACLEGRRPFRWIAYALFGMTVWLPIRDVGWDSSLTQITDLVIWTTGLVLLLNWARGRGWGGELAKIR